MSVHFSSVASLCTRLN